MDGGVKWQRLRNADMHCLGLLTQYAYQILNVAHSNKLAFAKQTDFMSDACNNADI